MTNNRATMFRRTSITAAFIAFALVVSVPAPAQAIDTAKGYAGMCKGADALTGTTVVIDFQSLNGNGGVAAPTITRCSPNTTGVPRTGIKALQDAGISVTGVSTWGLGFVCRLEGRPSASEVLKTSTNPTYQEACVNTPPANAYWSYWVADGSGSTWDYATAGALNRTVTPGGFDGWSFSMNASAGTNPMPRFTPHNPAIPTGTPTVSLMHDDIDRTIALGQSVTFTWTSTNATTVTATQSGAGAGAWAGPLTVGGGSKSVTPTAKGTYTYTATAKSSSGKSATAATTLTVQ